MNMWMRHLILSFFGCFLLLGNSAHAIKPFTCMFQTACRAGALLQPLFCSADEAFFGKYTNTYNQKRALVSPKGITRGSLFDDSLNIYNEIPFEERFTKVGSKGHYTGYWGDQDWELQLPEGATFLVGYRASQSTHPDNVAFYRMLGGQIRFVHWVSGGWGVGSAWGTFEKDSFEKD